MHTHVEGMQGVSPRSSCRFPSNHWRSFILLVAGGNHWAIGRRDCPRYARFENVVDVWLQVVFLWLHSPAAAGTMSPFDVLVESHGRVVFLFAGQTLPNSSPSPPTSTLLSGLSCRRRCRGVGSQHA